MQDDEDSETAFSGDGVRGDDRDVFDDVGDGYNLYEQRSWRVRATLVYRAVAAIVGSIFVWVGVWNVFEVHLFPENTWVRDWLYFIVGILMTVGTGTFYTNAGLQVNNDDADGAVAMVQFARGVQGFFPLAADGGRLQGGRRRSAGGTVAGAGLAAVDSIV
eukprot:TRINITY_DN52310_c0_g1_i2.p3 TRINITY_DN52310_c0_g1~~TRINITY_DN52310_c0_g1_i2.p3  ORF type:complete len:161 (-),score=76.90 TRINITY_DN52310_c0_g1_i2:196-678(-)